MFNHRPNDIGSILANHPLDLSNDLVLGSGMPKNQGDNPNHQYD